jgi:ubiquinone/menaquinone biosynthesis C-methylase UbiE
MMTNSYDITQEYTSPSQELQRLHAQLLLSWPQEARLLTWLGLQNGMSVLELGSGPGFVTEKLRQLVPDSPITVLDADAGMLACADEYLQQQEVTAVAFIHADAADTHLPDNSFDFVIARYLFQHLADPQAAAVEALRILKPNGRLAVIDVDGALWGVVRPSFPQLQTIHAKGGRTQASNGGNRLIGRDLWAILQHAGFHEPQLDAFVYHSDDLGIEPFLPQIDPARLLRTVKEGEMTLQDFTMAHALFQKFQKAPNPYVMLVGLMASGTKV